MRMLPGCTSSKELVLAGRGAMVARVAQDANMTGRMAKIVVLRLAFISLFTALAWQRLTIRN